MIFFLILVYLGIGVMRVQRQDGPGGGIAMIAHNVPMLGVLMLVVCILFWPIEKFALLVVTAFIES